MQKWGKILIGVVVIGVVIAGVLVALNKNATRNGANKVSESTNNSTNTDTNSGNNTTNQQESQAADMTITYDGSGFTLSATTVKSGGTVKIVNNSSKDLQFASDPHPIHTANPELNVGAVAPGESVTITLTKTGTWGFHNHLNHNQHGTITVE